MTVVSHPIGVQRDAVNFDVAGTALDEWLGKTSHPSVLAAAEKAMALPDEKFLVCVVNDPSVVDATKWAANERRALARWFAAEHAGASGRLRLMTQTHLEPKTLQNVKVVAVVYEPKWKDGKRK